MGGGASKPRSKNPDGQLDGVAPGKGGTAAKANEETPTHVEGEEEAVPADKKMEEAVEIEIFRISEVPFQNSWLKSVWYRFRSCSRFGIRLLSL
jgi:hypothetical protein